MRQQGRGRPVEAAGVGIVLAAAVFADTLRAGFGPATLAWAAALVAGLAVLFGRRGGFPAFAALTAGPGAGLVAAGLAGTDHGGDDGAFVTLGAALVLVPLLPVLIGALLTGAQRRRQGVLARDGVAGVATLVEVVELGELAGLGTKVRLRLRIEPADGVLPPYEVTKVALAPPGGLPRPGDGYPVLFERTDPRNWAFASGTPDGRSPGGGVPALWDVRRRGLPPAVPPPAPPAGA